MSKVARKQQIKPPFLLTHLVSSVFKTNLLTMVIALVTLASAFALIVLSHKQRNLYGDLEQLHTERNQLDKQWRQLRLEQRVWAEHTRLEDVATQQLGMKNLDVKSERIVRQVNDQED